uniref:Uncharacterized protein n=1 Tax=Triticum urartu TaxID=4572 RepID=A0A8R7PM64_TRIUA
MNELHACNMHAYLLVLLLVSSGVHGQVNEVFPDKLMKS